MGGYGEYEKNIFNFYFVHSKSENNNLKFKLMSSEETSLKSGYFSCKGSNRELNPAPECF